MADQLPPHTPIYARLTGVELACPWCGVTLLVEPRRHYGSKPSRSHARAPEPTGWDRYAGVLHCYGCGVRMALGVLVYPIARDRGHHELTRAEDQRPDARVLADLRILRSKGAFMRLAQTTSRPRNRVIGPGCSCGAAWSPACAVHGGAGYSGEQAIERPARGAFRAGSEEKLTRGRAEYQRGRKLEKARKLRAEADRIEAAIAAKEQANGTDEGEG